MFVFFCFVSAYGKVYLVRKRGGPDNGQLYAMKVLSKAAVVTKKKTAEHTKTERQVSIEKRTPSRRGVENVIKITPRLPLSAAERRKRIKTKFAESTRVCSVKFASLLV
jgi:hypothetical protein